MVTGTSVCPFVKDDLPLFWGVKTIRHLYCPFPGWALTHPVYWKEFNRRQLGPYRAWSHPKSLVMIVLFYTGSLQWDSCFCHYSLVCYSRLKWTSGQEFSSIHSVSVIIQQLIRHISVSKILPVCMVFKTVTACVIDLKVNWTLYPGVNGQCWHIKKILKHTEWPYASKITGEITG